MSACPMRCTIRPQAPRARKLLEERRLGKILEVQASAVYSGPYRGWDPKSDWYLDPRSGGPLYDWGSHLLDLLVYITHLDVEVISAMAQKSLPGLSIKDNIVAAFQARKGIVGTINLAWGTRGKLGILLGNAKEILTDKAGAFIRRKANEGLYDKATRCFIEEIRGEVQGQAAMWDAVHVHEVLGAIAASIEQGKPVESGALREDVKQEVA